MRLGGWLRTTGLWQANLAKPPDPKAAFGAALREVHRRAVAPVFGALAAVVGLDRCKDPSFARLRGHLRSWFPA